MAVFLAVTSESAIYYLISFSDNSHVNAVFMENRSNLSLTKRKLL